MLEVISVLAPVLTLSAHFDFPEILREPASVVLPLFLANQATVVPAYYVFMLSGLLFVPLSVAFGRMLKPGTWPGWWQALISLGVLTAVFQSIGFSRWLFVMPFLAEQHRQEPAQQPTVALLYEMLNRYAGTSVGEHLGFIAMGFWTILLSRLLVNSRLGIEWLSRLGLPIGVALLVSTLEHFGGHFAPLFGTINFLSNAAWTGWMFGLSGWILRGFIKPLRPLTYKTL